jgi:hypothetical protein
MHVLARRPEDDFGLWEGYICLQNKGPAVSCTYMTSIRVDIHPSYPYGKPWTEEVQ